MLDNLQDRLQHSSMDHYWQFYEGSPRWNGEPLTGKRLIVYGEQGLGDIIQFARYLPDLKAAGCHLILHCTPTLHRIFADLVDEFVKDSIPEHDYHVLSMSLPFLLNRWDTESPAYLPTPPLELDSQYADCLKIGIAWEGNPNHSDNPDRCCPLRFFGHLAQPKVRLFMLQNKIHDQSLLNGVQDLPLYSVPINDFWDTASLVGAMDVVISVDTSILHLAGAMGKPTYALLSHWHDTRWHAGSWYQSVTLLRQQTSGDWNPLFATLCEDLKLPKPQRLPALPEKKSILLTGGIGDVIALECYMPVSTRTNIGSIYYATRAQKGIQELFQAANIAAEHVPIWDDFSEVFAFYSKIECGDNFQNLPLDWPRVTDWSIACRFQEIEDGRYPYHQSTFIKHRLANVDRFQLPKRYVVIVPSSDNDPRMQDRNFSDQDWNAVFAFLEQRRIAGVVVNHGNPTGRDGLIDLSNQTTLPEAVEITKGAEGYIGIDSCLSVVAAKLFRPPWIQIKSRNPHLFKWRHVYYAPKTDFSFLTRDIT